MDLSHYFFESFIYQFFYLIFICLAKKTYSSVLKFGLIINIFMLIIEIVICLHERTVNPQYISNMITFAISILITGYFMLTTLKKQ